MVKPVTINNNFIYYTSCRYVKVCQLGANYPKMLAFLIEVSSSSQSNENYSEYHN